MEMAQNVYQQMFASLEMVDVMTRWVSVFEWDTIYYFHTANTSIYTQKKQKKDYKYMHCTHPITDNVKICTPLSIVITAQFIDNLPECG